MSEPDKVEKATAGLPLTRDEREAIAERVAALEKREAVTAADVRKIVEQVLAERDEKSAKAAAPEVDEEW